MASQQKALLAGVGRRCINPPPNIAHGGWGAQKHEQAEGIDLDLWVTALVLSDGQITCVHLDVDIQILTNQRADQIRGAVAKSIEIPISNVRAAATHTHSGPVPYQSWIEKGFEMVDPWFAFVAQSASEAAMEAMTTLQPVQVRAGRGECLINANRRCVTPEGERFLGINPDGPSDHEVLVVRLDSEKNRPLAILTNFACHPTIMGPLNRLITPDYPGVTKRVVEENVGGRCLFFQGCAGDQGPVQGFIADTSVYRSLGAVLGLEISKVALGLTSIPPEPAFREVVPSGAPLGMYDCEFPALPSGPLNSVEIEIPVPVRDGLPDRANAEAQLNHWKERLKKARANNNQAEVTEATYMARRADIQLRMADDFGGKKSVGVRTHILTFGDVAFVGCNIEPFAEIGIALKKDSPFPFTFICGYTNGRLAYMPTPDEWGKGGYEVDNSPFDRHAADVLQRQILDILARLRRDAWRDDIA